MKKSKAKACVEAFREAGSRTDVQGWYTGTDKEQEQAARDCRERGEDCAEALRPVQDADDL